MSATTANSATLSWPAATDDVGVAKFVLTKDGAPLAEVTETTYSLTGLSPNSYLSVTVVAVDAAGNTSMPLDAEVAPAPPLELPTDMPPVTGDFCATVQALTSGSAPLQYGVAASALPCPDVGIVRARITTASGSGVPGLRVTALGHPELGETRTRANGDFDFAAPAGPLVIDVRAAPFLAIQRTLTVERLDFTHLGRLVVTRKDSKSTAVTTAAGGVHESTARSDSSGSRKVVVTIPAGVLASLRFADGGTQVTPTVTLRVTEATAGDTGPKSMPASLPATSAFTFAADFSVDEAVAAGAAGVTFSQPVAFAVDDFLGAPVGSFVPQGAYDGVTGRWETQDATQVVRVLGGNAIDSDGDGAADTKLALLPGEAEALSSHFDAGTAIWRGVTTHFSTVDLNYKYKCIGTCLPPLASALPKKSACLTCTGGSIIETRNQTLGERIPLAGTPFQLVYASQRATQQSLSIPLTLNPPLDGGTALGLLGGRYTLDIAGQHFEYEDKAARIGDTHTFVWDGKDAWGRAAKGPVLARAAVGLGYQRVYVYDEKIPTGSDFGGWPPADGAHLDKARDVVYLMTDSKAGLGEWTQQAGLGGLGLDVLHGFSSLTGTVYLGDGTFYRIGEYGLREALVAGGGSNRADGVKWKDADLVTVTSLTEAPDGTLYFVEYYRRVRMLRNDGQVVTVAGQTTTGYAGDGQPGSQALFSGIDSVAAGPDGTLYLADRNNQRIRAVDPLTGLVSTVVGTGTRGFSPNGTPASQTQLDGVRTVFVTRDGVLHFFTLGADGRAVMRGVRRGVVRTEAGGATTEAQEASTSTGVTFRDFARYAAEGPDGSVYIASYESDSVVRRLWPDGRVTLVAGAGNSTDPNEVDARATCFSGLGGIAVDGIGNVYVAETGGTGCGVRGAGLRVISPDGRLSTAAGFIQTPSNQPSPPYQPTPADGLATTSGLYQAHDIILLKNGKLAFVHQGSSDTIHTLENPISVGLGTTAVPSQDGDSLYLFDVSGRHLETRDAVTGQVRWRFEWRASGDLAAVVDGEGNRTTVQRDASGKPTGLKAPDGQVTTLALDGQGRVTTVTDTEGRATGLTYGANGLLGSFTDANGHAAHFTFDAEGRLLTDTNAKGAAKTLARDGGGDDYTVTFTTAEGRSTRYGVSQSEATKVYANTEPDGTMDTMRQAGAAVTTTSADGTVRSARLLADPRFGTPTTRPASTSITTPSGLTLTATSKRVVTTDGGILAVASATDTTTVNGKTWTTVYTASDSTWRSTSPLGRTASVVLDAKGRPTTLTRPGLLPVAVTYDARGRVETVTQGTRSTTLVYGTNGFLASSTDALSKKTSVVSDSTGWTSSVVRPDGKATGFVWDQAGNLSSLTPPGKPAHAWGYSVVDETTSYTPPTVPGSSPEAYAWDKDSLLGSVTNADGSITAVTRDAAGRVSKVTAPWATTTASYDGTTGLLSTLARGGQGLAWTYDGALVTEEKATGSIGSSVDWTYNAFFRPTSVSVNGSGVAYGFDDDELLTSAGPETLTRDATTGFLASTATGSVATQWSFNGYGEVASLSAKAGSTALYSESLTWDDAGRLVGKTEVVQGVSTAYVYGYDDAGRLVSEAKNASSAHAWSYDDNGNRTSADGVASTYDAQDRQLSTGAVTYTHDAFGNRTSRTDTSGTTTYVFDGEAHLLKATLPSGTALEYLYDSRGRRVGKKRNGVLEKGWVYDGQWRVVAELDGSGAVTARFVYGELSHSPDIMLKGGSTYRLVHDFLGSVRLVVDSSSGAVAQRLDYDSWGGVTADSAPGLQPFGFAGGMFDSDTGLTHFGARDYDAANGRWGSKDPTSFEGGDLDLYAFCGNRPTDRIDPSGLLFFGVTPELTRTLYALEHSYGRALGNRIRELRESKSIRIYFKAHESAPEWLKKWDGAETEYVRNSCSEASPTIVAIAYSRDYAASAVMKKFGLGLTFDQLIAHELGHAWFGYTSAQFLNDFSDMDPSVVDSLAQSPLGEAVTSVSWENSARWPGPYRPYH